MTPEAIEQIRQAEPQSILLNAGKSLLALGRTMYAEEVLLCWHCGMGIRSRWFSEGVVIVPTPEQLAEISKRPENTFKFCGLLAYYSHLLPDDRLELYAFKDGKPRFVGAVELI